MYPIIRASQYDISQQTYPRSRSSFQFVLSLHYFAGPPLGGICSKHPLFSVSLPRKHIFFCLARLAARIYTDTRLFPPCMEDYARSFVQHIRVVTDGQRYPPFPLGTHLSLFFFLPFYLSLSLSSSQC